jgi:hypothetical protein
MSSAPPGFVWCGRKGDLQVYLTHVQFPEDHDEHGAIYIRNEHRKNDEGGSPAFLLPLRDFWEFRPEDRDRGRFHSYANMQQELANASVALYGLDVPEYRYRIHDILMEFVDDVKNLKPPPMMTRAEWEAQLAKHRVKLVVDGQRIIG